MGRTVNCIVAAAIVSAAALGGVYGYSHYIQGPEAEPQRMNIEVHIADK